MRFQARPRPSLTEFTLCVCLPIVFTAIAIQIFVSINFFAGDFHKEFWPAGLRVLHGQSPYVLQREQIDSGRAFPYPAPAALLLAPFALLPRGVSDVLFTLICFAALFATLWVLNVRDWRLYGLVLLGAPVVNAWQTANLTLLLGLGIALVWRYRDRPAAAGVVAALIVSLKPFVWPIAIWLLVTRRYAAALYCLLAGLLVNGAAFAVLGFGEIGRYLSDASKVSGEFFRHAYTATALALHLGFGTAAAAAIGVIAAVVVLYACVVLGRRGDELGALALCVALMFAATPVLWMHYFALALVPLAIARPRLEPVWALPIVLIVCGSRSTEAWQIVLTLLVIAVLIGAAVRRPRAEFDARALRASAGLPNAA
ncbi:MAG: glycosyltransferase 87 family protein [Solirubrobacteraceae bacterium]